MYSTKLRFGILNLEVPANTQSITILYHDRIIWFVHVAGLGLQHWKDTQLLSQYNLTVLDNQAQSIPIPAMTPRAVGRLVASEMNPMSTGPNKKPPMAKVFMVASPAPLAKPGMRAALPYMIGAPQETPAPTQANPMMVGTV